MARGSSTYGRGRRAYQDIRECLHDWGDRVMDLVGIVLAVMSLVCLCLPAGASAHGAVLPKDIAEREVEVYEYLYWNNFTMPISVSQCHRYNATHVSCLARFELNGLLDFSRDYVSLHHGEPVVDPGSFESLLIS